MSDADEASEAGRLLARARWGSATLDRAVVEVVSRSRELSSEQLDQLRAVTRSARGLRVASQKET